jgi:hypothetical protein
LDPRSNMWDLQVIVQSIQAQWTEWEINIWVKNIKGTKIK